MKRVVVTGIGLLTSLGINSEISWSNLINRKSGIKKIKNFDVSDLPCKIAGYISHDQDDENFYDRSLHLENKEIKRNDRFIQYGLAAAIMAVQDSGIENLNEVDKLEVGVSTGSGIGGLETIYNGSITVKEKKKLVTYHFTGKWIDIGCMDDFEKIVNN